MAKRDAVTVLGFWMLIVVLIGARVVLSDHVVDIGGVGATEFASSASHLIAR